MLRGRFLCNFNIEDSSKLDNYRGIISCFGYGPVSKRLAGTGSLVISFTVSDSVSIINIVSTTKTTAIRKLALYLDGKLTKEYKCVYGGNMIFFNNGIILQTEIFQYNEDNCRHFLYEMDNKVLNASMSNESKSFFENLAAGIPHINPFLFPA